MEPDELAKAVVDKMFTNDQFSQWLGIEVIEVKPGYCLLKMEVRDEMLNGFKILHGGVTFSLADSALAFASNSYGRKSVSIEANMSYTGQVEEGDILIATAEVASMSHKIAVFNVTVKNLEDATIALFKGTVYRTERDWFDEKEEEE
jgi:acyl-CoA thioesterase